jgi:hypothetical protein
MEITDIKQQVKEVFDPLAIRLGLNGPIELSLTPTNFHLGYTSHTIGLEIEVEMIDFFVYALLFRPNGNEIPLGYDDENGKRQKLYIQQALKELSIDVNRETHSIQKLGGDYRNCPQMAERLARLVGQYWPELSQNPALWFS